MDIKSILDYESQWSQVVATRPDQGSEKWLTYLRQCLFEILGDNNGLLYELEKLFHFAHFVADTESIGTKKWSHV